MSNPEQEQALATIAALAQSLSGTELTDIQLDLLDMAQRMMTNIAVQRQMAANLKAVDPAPVEFDIGEPVNVDSPLFGQPQRATIIGKIQHLRGFDYQTSATGQVWMRIDSLHKVK